MECLWPQAGGRRADSLGRLSPDDDQGPLANWEVCLQAAHPGYIGWEEFVKNQRRLTNNINRYEAGHSSVPRASLFVGGAVAG